MRIRENNEFINAHSISGLDFELWKQAFREIFAQVSKELLPLASLLFLVIAAPAISFDGSAISMIQEWSKQILSVIAVGLSYAGLKNLQGINVTTLMNQPINMPSSDKSWMRFIAGKLGNMKEAERVIDPSAYDLVLENLPDGNIRAVVNVLDLKEKDVIAKLQTLNQGISREENRKFEVAVMWDANNRDRRFSNRDQIKRFLKQEIGSTVEVFTIKTENNLFNLQRAIEIIEKESSSIDYSLVVINKGNHWDLTGLIHKVLEIAFREEGLEAVQHNFEAEGQFAVNH